MNIFFLELRNQRKGALIGTASICGVILVLLAFFPAMQTESMQALANAKLEGISTVLLAALGLTNMFDFSLISAYFGYALQYVALAAMVLITQQAVALLIKEETDGTIEYLCAKPVSRDDILGQKLLAHLLLVTLTMLTYALTTAMGYLMVSDYALPQAMEEAAILFGPERMGLSTEDLRHCQKVVRIPTDDPETSSLNLAQSVLILGYELIMAAGGEPEAPTIKPAPHTEVEEMYDDLTDALLRIGFLPPDNPGHWLMNIKKIFNRSLLTSGECNLWRGVCRQIRWALSGREKA